MTSKGIVVKPFDESHFEGVDLRAYESDVVGIGNLAAVAAQSSCGVYLYEGVVLAVVGFIYKWSGVVEVFVIPTVNLPRYALPFIRHIKANLKNMFECMHIHRMFTFSKSDEQTNKWMKCLGFTYEGTAVGWRVRGEDYKLWARYS